VYNVFFHPLQKIPGPILSAASEAPHLIAIFTGNGVSYVKGIHDRYGPVVRIGPNRVACNSSTAIKDVYGHQPGRTDLIKDPELYIMPPSGVRGIGESDDINHDRQRRYLGPAFSNKALEEQEYLTQETVDILMERLKERVGQEVDLVPWFDWTLFDLIGTLMPLTHIDHMIRRPLAQSLRGVDSS
jgi:cytochrome P450